MIRQVARTIARYGMTRPGDRVCVAVSGGADSVALLHILRELADELGISLAVTHLNHKLRGPESDADQEFVAALASYLGLKLFTQAVDVRAEAQKRGENLEQVGRDCRYQWFTRLLSRELADKIAVGHTRSDQAETVLYRLLRGAGSAGLAGVRPVLCNGVVRPLIAVSRQQVLAYLGAGNHTWREDASNRSMRFERNQIRHELMPQLTEHWNPNLEPVLAQLAAWAQDEEDYWRQRVSELAAAHLDERADGIYLQVPGVSDLPAAAVKRLLRAAIERARGTLRGIDYEHVQAVRDLLLSERGTGHLDLPGVVVSRSFDRLRVAAPGRQVRLGHENYSIDVSGPGVYEIPGWSSYIEFKLSPGTLKKPGYNERGRKTLDWNKLPKPLKLRGWRPGDRYQPLGFAEEKKLKWLFQQRKVALWDRAGWPVLCSANSTDSEGVKRGQSEQMIIWARRFGPSADFAPDEHTQTVLEITEIQADGSGISRNQTGRRSRL